MLDTKPYNQRLQKNNPNDEENVGEQLLQKPNKDRQTEVTLVNGERRSKSYFKAGVQFIHVNPLSRMETISKS